MSATSDSERSPKEATPAVASSGDAALGSSQPPGDAAASSKGSPTAKCKVTQDIQNLITEQKHIREEKKRIANELKNAQRRRHRLKHKARLLSPEDLEHVMILRREETEVKANKARKA